MTRPPYGSRRSWAAVLEAVGIACLADLARQRSLASAALLLLRIVDEIEGPVFVALGIVIGRIDLFLSIPEVLFPAVVTVSAVVAFVRNWTRPTAVEELPALEMLELATLSQRIGVARQPSRARATCPSCRSSS